MKCLVVVAHPDDEIIWMGGLILRHPRWEWQVLSLCRADDPDRAPRFDFAAKQTGASAFMSDLDDSPALMPLSADMREIRGRISSIAAGHYDLVFTHGENGEYGHERHRQVHEAVREMVAAGEIDGDMLTFASDGQSPSHPAPDADITIELSAREFAEKRRIVREIYGFGPGSFEYESSGPVEAFRTHHTRTPAGQLKSVLETSEG